MQSGAVVAVRKDPGRIAKVCESGSVRAGVKRHRQVAVWNHLTGGGVGQRKEARTQDGRDAFAELETGFLPRQVVLKARSQRGGDGVDRRGFDAVVIDGRGVSEGVGAGADATGREHGVSGCGEGEVQRVAVVGLNPRTVTVVLGCGRTLKVSATVKLPRIVRLSAVSCVKPPNAPNWPGFRVTALPATL